MSQCTHSTTILKIFKNKIKGDYVFVVEKNVTIKAKDDNDVHISFLTLHLSPWNIKYLETIKHFSLYNEEI
jgi:hypothetical protein